VLIAIFDTETATIGGGKPDPERDMMIEAAAVVAVVDKRGARLLMTGSAMFQPSASPEDGHATAPWLPAQLADAVEHGVPLTEIPGMDCADVALAHNARYDQAILARHCGEQPASEWVCTYHQFRWLDRRGVPIPPCAQNELAARLGVPVQHAHRAIGDCLTLLACLQTQPDPECQLRDAMNRTLWCARLDVSRDAADRAGLVWQHDARRPGLWMTEGEALALEVIHPVKLVRWQQPVATNLRAGFERKDDLRALGCQWDPEARSWWTYLVEGDRPAIPEWATATRREA